MVFWLVVTGLVFGVIVEKRRRVTHQLHTSYCGHVEGVEVEGDSLTVTLRDASVGRATSRGEHLEDLEITEMASVQVKIKDFDQVEGYCDNWAENGESVRIEMVHDNGKLAMIALTDDLGRGLIHARKEFMGWGARGVE